MVQREDRALFGRKPEWPSNRYSTIAGFVEPGESAEQAVVREVAEETGIDVTAARYHSSQPWPFPGSLMLGYHAEAGNDRISLNDHELEDALWLSREEIAIRMEQGLFVDLSRTGLIRPRLVPLRNHVFLLPYAGFVKKVGLKIFRVLHPTTTRIQCA